MARKRRLKWGDLRLGDAFQISDKVSPDSELAGRIYIVVGIQSTPDPEAGRFITTTVLVSGGGREEWGGAADEEFYSDELVGRGRE